MPPRQQMPYNPNYFGQQPFQPMGGMRGPGPAGFGGMRPGGMQGNFQGGAGRRSGGLLSKILNRGSSAQTAASQFNPLQGAAGFQRSAQTGGGSFLKNLMNPGSINGFLNNTQSVLKTAQQVGPMFQQVQQYGPLVKNLPAMWKLYRGLSAAETEEEDISEAAQDEKKEKNEESSESRPHKKKPSIKQNKSTTEERPKKSRNPGGSQPKLYV
ncbi:hypothetical protein D3H55_15570 [Bacillus salacetis]|uniref:YqfQ-like protein n=1 Tax=Bacillus salacetis TaxID=2315464 RepID=A0A3A1QYA5_9BACI|nr:VrrA/YqfQ family protein [Bacillus salacetis]RIW31028.1 hypothetical protein D3H55_15570 [Bacillus salacetis]